MLQLQLDFRCVFSGTPLSVFLYLNVVASCLYFVTCWDPWGPHGNLMESHGNIGRHQGTSL